MTDHRKTAVYIRLSAEDDNVDGRAKKESDSVTSQRILLKSFVIDELGVVESDILEYVDDGVSGTHSVSYTHLDVYKRQMWSTVY